MTDMSSEATLDGSVDGALARPAQGVPAWGGFKRLLTAQGVVALLFGLLGAALIAGGIDLAILGGTPYYLIVGAALLGSAWWMWRADQRALWLYALIVVGTLAWSLVEAGFDFFALAARNGMFVGLSVMTMLPAVWRGLQWKASMPRPGFALPVTAGIALVAIAAVLAPSVPPPTKADGMTTLPPAPPFTPTPDAGRSQWTNVGRDLTGNRYTPAAQITPANVGQLELAWSYRTGDMPTEPFSFQSTNLQVEGKLLVCTPSRQLHALDAATGRLLWRFVPPSDTERRLFPPSCRGVSYHAGAAVGGPCSGRAFISTEGNHLWAVDVRTGRPCPDFGRKGVISLGDGFDPKRVDEIKNTSPGTVVGDVIIIGMKVLDGQSRDMPSGVIRAFDVRSGRLVWAWDAGHPDRTGLPPTGEIYTNSTPNAWPPFSADPSLSLVYVPTGNPPPDFFGGYRSAVDEKYGSSLVALDTRTGRVRWSFQTVHHDLWDLDLPSQPILADWPARGGPRKAVVQLTKQGDIFVLDRATGKPIVPVNEVAVSGRGGIPEERYSPTQPSSQLSLAPRTLRETDMWGLTPIDQMLCRIAFRRYRYDGMYTRPGVRTAIAYSGGGGITNWGGGSIDLRNQILVTNTTYALLTSELLRRKKGDVGLLSTAEFGLVEMAKTPYRYYTGIMLGALAMPCNRPPWGELIGIDMRSGRIAWREPLGTAHDSGPLGIPLKMPVPVGTPNLGGTTTIGSGITFIAATMDHMLRAVDTRTGRRLWSARLPAGGNSNPISYVADGKQFVVLSAGGHYMLPSKKGDYVLAYALPQSARDKVGKRKPV